MKWGIYLCSEQVMPLITGDKKNHLLKKIIFLCLNGFHDDITNNHLRLVTFLLLINFYSCIDVSDEKVRGIKSNSPSEQPKG